ncbi:hypothetical protein C8Q80DRAFT_1094486 [Daedaleopsis nitida]|nr:hypothetical protein C8Q80DRAFT_1094486 [Daedaleopsis nitida]
MPRTRARAESSTTAVAASTSPSPQPSTSQSQTLGANEDGYTSASSSSSSSSTQSSDSEGSRRAKHARVTLDPSQPPTTKGTARARVYVACHECRSRRVRCDGAKPACFNCKRRHPERESCIYDVAPRRRGVDKAPGLRIRSAVGHRAPRKSQSQRARKDDEVNEAGQPPAKPSSFEDVLHSFDPASFDPDAVDSYRLPTPPPMHTTPQDEEREEHDGEMTVEATPSMQFARDTWWEALLTLYSSDDADPSVDSLASTVSTRSATTKQIFLDLRATMSILVHWANFVHPRRLFESLVNPNRRNFVQPSLLLSMLAIGALVQGSELRGGAKGRRRALKLVEHAHSALQASLNSNWIDIGLVQAAWFMACFEFQGHPERSWTRRRSAMVLLDSIIRLMSLNSIDAGVPETQYSIFQTYTQMYSTGGVPANTTGSTGSSDAGSTTSSASGANRGCECEYYIQQQWPSIAAIAPLYGVITMWPLNMSEADIRKEECRRTVWSSVILSASHYCFTADRLREPVDLSIADYRSYALLFPGEAFSRTGLATIRRDNVWSLHIRAKVLCQTSARYQRDQTLSLQERAQFATNACLEADAIEAAVARHTCHVDNHILWQIRDALSVTKMCVSYELKQYDPRITTDGTWDLYREKIAVWLHEMMNVGKIMWERLQADDDARRPILVPWLMGHIIRALRCYESDPALVAALQTAKTLLVPMEYLMRLWPCADQRDMWQPYRYQLVKYCLEVGLEPPQAWVPPIDLYESGRGSSPGSGAGLMSAV